MTDGTTRPTVEELEQQVAEELRDREAMAHVDADTGEPVDVGGAWPVLSGGSTAYADAERTSPVRETT